MNLKHAYAGTPHVRKITANDFKSAGVEDQTQVEWSPKNKHVAEVSDAAGRWLLDNEPGDWELIESDDGSSKSSGAGTDGDGSSDAGTAPNATGTKRPRSS